MAILIEHSRYLYLILCQNKSVKIGETSYFINWYAVPAKNVSGLVMVMIRSNRPSTLTAGKIFDISLQGFCDVSILY